LPFQQHQKQHDTRSFEFKNDNKQNYMFTSPSRSYTQTTSSSLLNSNLSPPPLSRSLPRRRRLSYHFGQINSILQPVRESRPNSPIAIQHCQQQRDLDSKFKLLFCSNNNNQITQITSESNVKKNNNFQSKKQRSRAISIGCVLLSKEKNSITNNNIDLNNNLETTLDMNNYQSKSLSNLSSSFGTLDEKAAKSGNIFQKRDDWSIIHQLPVNKQNTINMRLEDEGPFGNDEIRLYVLSHFSSLGIKELPCLLCDMNLIIYDKFPLIDGTLFISPFNYNPKKAISTKLNSQSGVHQQLHQLIGRHKENQHYLFAICLKCLIRQEENDIRCKYCSKSWQTMGGNNLQIGTLYKYDIFAAFPCCQSRLNCNNCKNPIMKIDSDSLQYFSSYSETQECHSCKIKAYHFIKPLGEIFQS
jgi:hypothetical protein